MPVELRVVFGIRVTLDSFAMAEIDPSNRRIWEIEIVEEEIETGRQPN